MILNFRVTNFRCITDTVELDLVKPTLRTNVPRGNQTWASVTDPVIAIYGANASGKTTILDALNSVAHAVQSPGSPRIYQPSKLIGNHEQECRYEVSFTAHGVRYDYEISASAEGITWEALYGYPKGTQRMLFERAIDREAERPTIKAGSSLTGPTAEVARITRHHMLFLANARNYGHELLAPIARALAAGSGISHISFRERQDDEVLKRVVTEMIADEDALEGTIKTLINVADFGIDSISIKHAKIPPEVQERAKRVIAAINGGDLADTEFPTVEDVLEFHHTTGDGGSFTLGVHQQSSGTITWLTTAWHALTALKNGTVLLIDELDASLHPDLVRHIVELFKTEDLNRYGAQLIFTTHDVTLMSNSPVRTLEPRNVWFIERSADGRRELYSLDDFDNRAKNNNARRYLAGRFGARPQVDESAFPKLLLAPRS